MLTNEAELEQALSLPSPAIVEEFSAIRGDIVVIGAGGKMGPTLCLMARRALDQAGNHLNRVIAVSRWTDSQVRNRLNAGGVETISFDLLSTESLYRLPDAHNVVFMAGAKFGTSREQGRLWQTNAVVAGNIAMRYRDARIAAFSTGNVYPFVSVSGTGSLETDPLGPVGEYAMSCLGRERVFSFAAAEWGTPVSVVRLNYAVEPRYGVLADIIGAVHAGDPVDVSTGYVNVIWQRYASEVALRSLFRASPEPYVVNVAGREKLRVATIAEVAADLLDTRARFTGTEAPTALLSDSSHCFAEYGEPDLDFDDLVRRQVDWIREGGVVWSKPTKFQVRDGAF